jgi:hypothetical protein
MVTHFSGLKGRDNWRMSEDVVAAFQAALLAPFCPQAVGLG